jgi:hypothetical protein
MVIKLMLIIIIFEMWLGWLKWNFGLASNILCNYLSYGDDYYYYDKNSNNLFIYLTAELKNQLPNNKKLITIKSKKRPPLIPQNITNIYQNKC